MNDSTLAGGLASPGRDRSQSAVVTGSKGAPWSRGSLRGSGFDGDLGAADPDLLAALGDGQDDAVLVAAVARARLLVPVIAVSRAMANPEASSVSRSADMAVVSLTASDGQRAFPVFSSVGALSAWDATARPCPIAGSRAAQGAVTQRCDVMLLDCGSSHERVLRPSMVWALAQQRDWLAAHADPVVAAALIRATAVEHDVIDCAGEGDPAQAGILRVVLGLRPGLDASSVQALATRIAQRIATDGEARARIDGLSFTIRRA